MTVTLDQLKNKFLVRNGVDRFYATTTGLEFWLIDDRTVTTVDLRSNMLGYFSFNRQDKNKWVILGDRKLGTWDEDTLDLS